MSSPLVTVICLCYNHGRFLATSIQSVINQTYSNLEIIIVDDASTDGSQELIDQFKNEDRVKLVMLPDNLGNCAAFNRGLALAHGKYIIDLATDDVLMPDRIEKQVTLFETLEKEVGVIFSNTEYIDAEGRHLRWHYPVDEHKKVKQAVPQGNIFAQLLARYFISPPSMMMRKVVLDELCGYDRNLAYEDFDFWIRSSRHYQYIYQDLILTKVRKVENSLSSRGYVPGDLQLHSTYLVCKKAKKLISNGEEKDALLERVRYEVRQAVFSENFVEATRFFSLLRELDGMRGGYAFLEWLNNKRLKLSWLRKLYLWIRY
ncbi:glycosyltransferase [Fulvivirgaceae bacterium BMA12]|uniref:Glycosyltransferase n=1 Tax=Agaribacillus aureus TaxID=3051825 RepID=A0ABT8L7W1_9BACT|nr:glycosyltransferase [Fulvivirgaceae bacterium BMA12]